MCVCLSLSPSSLLSPLSLPLSSLSLYLFFSPLSASLCFAFPSNFLFFNFLLALLRLFIIIICFLLLPLHLHLLGASLATVIQTLQDFPLCWKPVLQNVVQPFFEITACDTPKLLHVCVGNRRMVYWWRISCNCTYISRGGELSQQ